MAEVVRVSADGIRVKGPQQLVAFDKADLDVGAVTSVLADTDGRMP
jgi:hypothetical protein